MSLAPPRLHSRRHPRGFAFYLAFPKRSIPSMSHASPRLRSLIASLAANASPARTLTKIARSMISRQRGGGVVDSKLVMSWRFDGWAARFRQRHARQSAL